jgi:hypothetical protein
MNRNCLFSEECVILHNLEMTMHSIFQGAKHSEIRFGGETPDNYGAFPQYPPMVFWGDPHIGAPLSGALFELTGRKRAAPEDRCIGPVSGIGRSRATFRAAAIYWPSPRVQSGQPG